MKSPSTCILTVSVQWHTHTHTHTHTDSHAHALQSEVQLDNLKESLEKSKQLTSGMVGILDSFTVRLKKLDETIVPVYHQTKRLTQLQESIPPTQQVLYRVV